MDYLLILKLWTIFFVGHQISVAILCVGISQDVEWIKFHLSEIILYILRTVVARDDENKLRYVSATHTFERGFALYIPTRGLVLNFSMAGEVFCYDPFGINNEHRLVGERK